VSLWAFGCGGGGPYIRSTADKSLLKTLLDFRILKLVGKQIGLKEVFWTLVRELDRPVKTWRRLHSDHNNPKLFREWLKLALDSRRKCDFFRDYGQSSISSFAGILTYLYVFLFSNEIFNLYRKGSINNLDALRDFDAINNILYMVIRNENLKNDFILALAEARYRLSNEQIQRIRTSERTNASIRKRTLEYYYDHETIDLVRERDRFIVDKYGYVQPPLSKTTVPAT